jgi:hypothetical protein
MSSAGLLIRGRLERTSESPLVINLMADRLDRLSLHVALPARDFR